MTTHELLITYGTSRGRDTYGYTLVTLTSRGETFRTCGGGYDMRGTVFADWLEKTYQDKLRSRLRHKTHYIYRKGETIKPRDGKTFYGSTLYADTGEIKLDGGCGFSSMETIAKAIGLSVRMVSAGKKADVIIVSEADEAGGK